jgi:hypothetical protein
MGFWSKAKKVGTTIGNVATAGVPSAIASAAQGNYGDAAVTLGTGGIVSPHGGLVSPEQAQEGVEKAADFAGVTAPNTSNLASDTEALRQARRDFAGQLATAGPRELPGQRTSFVTNENLGPAALSQAATIAQGRDVRAPSLSPLERASAEGGQASLGQAERAQAALGMPSSVSKVGFVGAARVGGIERADAGALDQAAANQSRGVQYEALGAVRDVLSGRAPSVAEIQLRNTLNRNVNAQNAAAAAGRGLSAAAMRRNAALNIGRLNANASSQGALLRAQEQADARKTLGALATDTRGQDLSAAQSIMGEQGTSNRFNAGQMNENQRLQAQLTTQGLQADADRLQGALNLEGRMGTDVNLANAGNQTAVSQANAQRGTDVSLANARNLTDTSMGNARMGTDVNLANAVATNRRGEVAGQMTLDADLNNAGRETQTNIAQAGMVQQTGLANQDALNTRAVDQGRLNMDASQFNVGAWNQTEGQIADRAMEGRQLDDSREASLRGGIVDAGTAAASAEQGTLDLSEAAKKRRTDMLTGAAKSTAKALGLPLG